MKAFCLFLFLFSAPAFAFCVKVDCSAVITQSYHQTKLALELEFKKVQQALQALKDSYQKNLDVIELENKLIEEQIALFKKQSLQNKEIVFLGKKFNAIQAQTNTIRTLE